MILEALQTVIAQSSFARAGATRYMMPPRGIHDHTRAIAVGVLACVLALPIMAFATGAWVNGQAANVVLGQPDFGSINSPLSASWFSEVSGVAIDPTSGKVFVVDSGSNRVMRFTSAAALTTGSGAEAWFGQPNANAVDPNGGGSSVSAKGFFVPQHIHIDSAGALWVADSGNNRVLRFDNASSKGSFADADAVLGQANFTTRAANRGGSVASNTMSRPTGIWHDGLGLWVGDYANNRVLGFGLPASKPNGAAADIVLGQADFTHNGTGSATSRMNSPAGIVVGGGTMYVADFVNARVLRFDGVDAKPSGSPADAILGDGGSVPSAAAMSGPRGVALDASGRLYVSDSLMNRVLVFNAAVDKPNGAAADNVLGQPDFVSVSSGSGPRALNLVNGIAFDNTANVLWVGDSFNYRALRFSPVISLLDVDASGTATKFDALTDGVLVVRYLFGLTGTPLTNGALGKTATRTNPVAVKDYLDNMRLALDIDNDGKVDVTDGLMILRYMFGLRGAALTNGAVGSSATRNNATLIEPYLQSLTQ